MVADQFDGAALTTTVKELLHKRQLSVSALCSATEALFLSGGLRQGWPIALAVADLAAAASTRPAGLADLLRLLARYAGEVPDPGPLPSHLLALVLDSSRTKAAMEARRLAAALRLDPATADPAAAGPAPARSGLWEAMTAPLEPLPSDVRLTDPSDPLVARGADLAGLRDLLSENYNGFAQSHQDICFWPPGYSDMRSRTGLTEPDRVLAATVAAVHSLGADAVRGAIGGVERKYAPVDVVAAVDLWAIGSLDRAAFWRLATGPAISEATMIQRWREQGVTGDEVRERTTTRSFAERLRLPDDPEAAALVVPRTLGTPLERFAFLRAVEALLRADRDPVVLSLPTWADGTLDLDDLLARLRAVAASDGMVGPLDLVQALHRLRDADPVRIDDVPTGLRTDPRFTDPEGVAGGDATDLVQRWLGLGGLPTLEPVAADGRWTASTVSPVPFGSLAAWPPELVDDPWALGPTPATIRLVPRWPDRVVANAFETWSLYDPRHFPGLVAGPFGVPLHDRLLALLTPLHNQRSFEALPTLADLARRERLDPTACAAAALGRHEAGTLSLKLLVASLQRAFDEVFRGVWPTALAIADALCGVTKKPAQLAELLRLLAAHAHEVPAGEVTVPPVLAAFAESRGSSKGQEAARHLVRALHLAAAS